MQEFRALVVVLTLSVMSATVALAQAPAVDSLRVKCYFSSMIMARGPLPLTYSSKCVRSRRLKRVSPNVNAFGVTRPSGVVDFNAPAAT